MRARLAVVVALAAAALGCGDTLVDHAAIILTDSNTCGDGQISCNGVCKTQSIALCGGCDIACGAAPANATGVCVPIGLGGHDGRCDYQCNAGLLRCASGCCSPALVAAGGAFSCASSTEGEVHCFGADASGELGDGSPAADHATAARLDPALTGSVTALTAGGAHACALSDLGTRCWGARAAFGADATGDALQPENVGTLAGATAISAGTSHTCAIVGTTVRCVGAGASAGGGTFTAAALGGTPLQVAAGDGFSCALVDAGGGATAVKCWGRNDFGQLGGGSSGNASPTLVAISVPSPMQHLAAGARHACAGAEARDSLWCWGDNGSNQLGDFATTILSPTLSARVNKAILAISGGGHATCAVENDASFVLSCWSSDGLVSGGSLPVGEPNHVASAPLSVGQAPSFSAGAAHTCYVDAAASPAKLKCFGNGSSGRLGDGSTSDSATPVLVLDR